MRDTSIFNIVPPWILVVMAALLALNLLIPDKKSRRVGFRRRERTKPGWLTLLLRKLFFSPPRESRNEEADVTQYEVTRFLTPTELRFFHVLSRVVGPYHYLGVKPRMVDLVKPSSNAIRLFNRVCSKHVDFVICDRRTMTPLLVIELDDWTHGSEKAQRSDTFKNEVFRHARLSILRVPVAAAYGDEALRVMIQRELAELGEPLRRAS